VIGKSQLEIRNTKYEVLDMAGVLRKADSGTRRSGSPPRPGRTTRTRGGRKSRRKTVGTGLRDQTQCRFCREGITHIDYKDIDTLSRLLTNRGKIFSRKRSGNCASCQRKVKRAIKRARFMALLPFTG